MMIERSYGAAPRTIARVAGTLYLYTIVTGLFAEFYVAGKLVVSSDPAATAANILASEPLFRLGVVNEMLGVAAYVGVSALLYALLKNAGKTLAVCALLFATVGNTVWAVGSGYQLLAIRFLHGGPQWGAFSARQLQTLAFEHMKLHDTALNVGMVFFGIYCMLIGILIMRSRLFARFLGMLLVVGGAFNLLNEIVAFAFPWLANRLPDALQLPGFIAELALTAWLLAIGVRTVAVGNKDAHG